ncbi:hypothetical protein ACHAW6_011974 [Cyclotella cf. meneghiniana]
MMEIHPPLRTGIMTSAPALAIVLLHVFSPQSHLFASGFSPSPPLPTIRYPYTAIQTSLPSSLSASDLLYQDQQNALLRRALHEQTLLTSRTPTIPSLVAPKIKGLADSGKGFASSSSSSDRAATRLAAARARILQNDGVLRIDSALSPTACDNLRHYVLEQRRSADETVRAHVDAGNIVDADALARIYYGVENRRVGRCDLQLSLLRGGFSRDRDVASSSDDDEQFPLADALLQLLGPKGTLRHLYERLVTPRGEFYELAAVVTDPGSRRQTIHPDLPWKPIAPLYVVFVALQDVTAEMGPTCFLVGTQTEEVDGMFNCGSVEEKDRVVRDSEGRLAMLNKGDCVVFDARTLHCGNANESMQTRALFNFSFRNPQVTGDLGYKGSMRPGYERAMTLNDVIEALNAYEGGEREPFAKYGNGMRKRGF